LDEDDHAIWVETLERLEDRRALVVEVGEPAVEEDQIESVGAEGFMRGRGAAGRTDLGAGRQRKCQTLQDPGIIMTETRAGGPHRRPLRGCARSVGIGKRILLPVLCRSLGWCCLLFGSSCGPERTAAHLAVSACNAMEGRILLTLPDEYD
jgi:hypothetical protein